MNKKGFWENLNDRLKWFDDWREFKAFMIIISIAITIGFIAAGVQDCTNRSLEQVSASQSDCQCQCECCKK